MKNLKKSKKISVAILSLTAAISIGASAVTALGGYASAAEPTKTYSVVKDLESTKGLFTTDSNEVDIQAGYTAPAYMNAKSTENSGVYFNFKDDKSFVTTTKTYKPNELKDALRFIPIVGSVEEVQGVPSISKFQIEIYNVADESEKITYYYDATAYSWYTDNKSALTVAASWKNEGNVISQTPAGLTWSTAGAMANYGAHQPYMRKQANGSRAFAGFSGGKIKSDGSGGTDSFKIGYVQDGTNVAAIAGPYDTNIEKGTNVTIPTFSSAKEVGLLRDLSKKDFFKTDGTGSSDYENLSTEAATAITGGGNGLISDHAFSGFAADANLKIKFGVTGGSGAILVSRIGGLDITSSFRSSKNYKGYVNVAYKMPEVKFFEKNPAGEAFNGTYVLTDVDGKVVDTNDTSITVDATQTSTEVLTTGSRYKFKKAGTYVMKYGYEFKNDDPTTADDEEWEKYGGNFEIEILDETGGVELNLTNDISGITDRNATVGNSYDVGATASSNIYFNDDESYVNLEVYIDGTLDSTINKLAKNHTYKFDKEGVYTFKYYAVDDVFTAEDKSETESPLTCLTTRTVNVSRNYYKLELGKTTSYSKGDALNKLVVNRDVVTFYDGAMGSRQFFDSADVFEMKVKVPNSNDYVELTADEKVNGYNLADADYGTYEFIYYLEYSVGSNKYYIPKQEASENETIKQIDGKYYYCFEVVVRDTTPPTIYVVGNDYITGGSKVSEGDGTVEYNVIKGTTSNFSELRAIDTIGSVSDRTNSITLSLTKNGVVDASANATFAANRKAYTYTFSDEGQYIFKFTASDDDCESNLTIIVNVKNEFYSIVSGVKFNDTYNTNSVLKLSSFDVLDSNGNAASNVTKQFEVKRNGVTVGTYNSLDFNPQTAGNYTVTFKAIVGGTVVDQKVYQFTVEDKTAPSITINGTIVKSAKVGQTIDLATVSATDNNDDASLLVTKLSVTLNGKEVNVYRGTLLPIEEGIYTVKYTATDLSGNVATYYYDINVTGGGNGSNKVLGVDLWALILGGLGVILIAAAAVVIFAVILKKPKTNQAIVNDFVEPENGTDEE